MAERKKRNAITSTKTNENKNIEDTQANAITLDVEIEETTIEKVELLKEKSKEETTQITLEIEEGEKEEGEKEEEEVVLVNSEDEEVVEEDEAVEESTKKTDKKKNTTKKNKKTKTTKNIKEAESEEENINFETGSHDIAMIEEYLKEDLCPTTQSLEETREEIINKINSFYLEENMTPEENVKLSHKVTNYIIEIENLISFYNRRARFLKGHIDDETKKYGKGSNAEERKLNAFLRLTNYTKKVGDKPVNLLIYLRVAEDMCEFLNLRLNVLYRISDNLKSDKYFFEKLEREMKK